MSYTPHPQDPGRTLLTQEAMISVRGVPLTSYIEEMLTSRVSLNAGKVRMIYKKLWFLISVGVGESGINYLS
jgi:hypothetical protein